ncbi:MAG: biopolymer transporter ExbD [Proteobacteria bacterium]|nr:biopolymer transporter ExbD [Pseudomonadota bacterium]
MASVGQNAEEALSLNIMPMLDIFSILILFLLMSFSTDPVSHDITSGLEVPISVTLRSLDEIPTVTMTKSELRFSDMKVAELDPATGDFTYADYQKSQGALMVLYEELKKMNEANKKRKQPSGESEEDDSTPDALTMEIDKSHKYIILRRIMLTAQQAGFFGFKLMVIKENE